MKNKQTGFFLSPDILISFAVAAVIIVFDALLFMNTTVHPVFIAVFSTALLADAIVEGKDYRNDETLGKHYDWVQSFKGKYAEITKDNVTKILEDEVGIVFAKVLEHAGVYKRDDAGKNAFLKFVDAVNA